MKNPDARLSVPRPRRFATDSMALWTLVFSLQLTICDGQGNLTPPGAPAPSMKSLDQLEPRIPVDGTHAPGNSTNVFNISQPGSYYLTTNIVISSGSAIGINASGVTLDLRGFTISSTNAAALNGLILYGAAVQDITVQNGHIQGGGTGFQNGIACATPFGSNPRNIRVADTAPTQNDAAGRNYDSEWVYSGPTGKLAYEKTPAGDQIMDFPSAGYMGGGVALPTVPVKRTVKPTVNADDTATLGRL